MSLDDFLFWWELIYLLDIWLSDYIVNIRTTKMLKSFFSVKVKISKYNSKISQFIRVYCGVTQRFCSIEKKTFFRSGSI